MSIRSRILYVDDDPDQLQMFALSLRDEYEVDTAGSGPAGLKMLRDHGPYAAVVADMRMPRMNGAQMLAVVRDISPRTVRILLTGDADLDSAMAAVNQAYVFRYLTKPWRREQLREVLSEAAREHAQDRARDGIGHRLSHVDTDEATAVATTPMDIGLGMVIAGRYRLDEALAIGSTATVFRAHDWVLEQDVALKLFPADTDEHSQARIKRELLIARQLTHPNVVRTHDVGVHGGQPFITMELLSGYDLGALVRPGGLSLPRAVDYLVQACQGLGFAHSLGITHCDIVPDNFLLDDAGHVYLLDFGDALDAQSKDRARTCDPHYCPPELVDDEEACSPAGDIYALGCVAFALLTGAPPFVGDEASVLESHREQVPPLPSELRPEVPERLDATIMRALQKDPASRYASCEEMADALRAVADALPSLVA